MDLNRFLGGIGLIYLCILIFLVVGWVINLFKILFLVDGGITAMFIARIVGAFLLPLGGLLGWF